MCNRFLHFKVFNEEINEKHYERCFKEFLTHKQELTKKKIEIKQNTDIIEKYSQEINNLIIKSQIPSREQMKTEALYKKINEIINNIKIY